jgi:RNA polymerase sigma-70 factor (ECF subfamily)
MVGSFKAGEDAGLESLYKGYSQALVGFCRGRLADPSEADDACHEALLNAHRARDGFREKASIWPWLATIAAHVCVEFNHARARIPPLFQEPEDDCIDEQLARRLRGDIVRRAVRRLPGRYRSLLFLKYWEQRSYDEIVEALGLTEPAVRSTMMRAKRALRAEVELVARRRGQWPLPALLPVPLKSLVRAWRRLADTARGLGSRFPGILEGAGGISGGAANLLAAAVLAASIVVAPVDHPEGLEIPAPAPPVAAQPAAPSGIDKVPPAPSQGEAEGAGASAVAAQVSTGGWSEEEGGRTYEGPSARVASQVDGEERTGQDTETGTTFVKCPPPEERSVTSGLVCGIADSLPD